MGTVWQRARSDEQKEQRRCALLDAANRMLRSRPLADISLNAIAREANVSKGNVYRYFETREALFLQLTLEAFDPWRSALTRRLERIDGDAEEVADAFVTVTSEHETFARLIAVLATVLERNVSTEVVFEFKLQFMAAIGEMLEAVGRALPDLNEDEVRHLMTTIYFHIAAAWPSTHPPPPVEEALARPELEGTHIDFETSLRTTALVTIAGLRAGALR